MDILTSIIKRNTNLTSYKFYNEFLEDVAAVYVKGGSDIAFEFFENGHKPDYDTFYKIDPLVVPLLLSLIEQLSKFHRHEIELVLYNNKSTIDVLEFLYKTDFFFILGNNKNPTFPQGRNIANFDEGYFGLFKGDKIRNEHRVRAYSLEDDNLKHTISKFKSEEQKRDFLISHYTYKVREHFEELLFDNSFTANFHNDYIDILSELITNAVLHSQSNAYALMFVNRFNTKFSISDNGVGFAGSMFKKDDSDFFKKNELKNILNSKLTLNNISPKILDNLFTIFETLFYSSIKDRQGIFDLMINVVLKSKGYFRLHCENSQIIISSRMASQLAILEKIRSKIYEIHTLFLLDIISESEWKSDILLHSGFMKDSFIDFCETAISKYSQDIKYSSLRFFKVKFRGVHIEVEIPNSNNYDNL